MYSEIKSNTKILINRLDENEKLLLEDIYNKTQEYETTTKFERLTDESGEFGGIYIEVEKDPNNKGIKVLGDNFPEAVLVRVGDETFYTIETDVPDNNYIVTFRTDEVRPESVEGGITPKVLAYDKDLKSIGFAALGITEDTPVNIYYSVNAEGYKPFNGKMTVTVEPKEETLVYISVVDSVTQVLAEDYIIQLVDSNGTEYQLDKDDIGFLTTKLKAGNYVYTITKEGYDVFNANLTITEEDLKLPVPINTAAILYPEGTTPIEDTDNQDNEDMT